MKVGSQEILLPTTMVGNYPNPKWYDGQPFAVYPKGEFIYDTISREALEDAVLAIVHDQEMAGLDIIADGKVFGGDSAYAGFVYHYYERMSGFKMSGPNIPLPIYSTLFSPTCVGPVEREHPFHLATLRATRKATNKPVKISYCGVGVLAAAATDNYYKDIKAISQAIGKALNEDFKELADNGADIIQLDEFVWPYGMGDWEIDALNTATEGVGCDVWVHSCWGNYSGTPGYFPDEKEKNVWKASELGTRDRNAHVAPQRAKAIFPHVNDANITALNYEVARTGPDDLKPLLDNDWDKPFVAGVIDVKSTITETADEVADRIRTVLEFVPADRLGLSTDCGLINLPRMIAQAKLRALSAGAEIVREELHAKG
ncbi:MAG TPA: cobalamin-independent methionine synthase II family protein [Sporichthyaceae bacterium]|jgi:5-methyltetrahydropteroyltriglutamate--homocysteine methyltransferase|nr:cobalamin-independent methionine synthase II family protein [Sporichthyaceae bacterium]